MDVPVEAFSEIGIWFEAVNLFKLLCEWSGPLSYVATYVQAHTPLLDVF